MFNASTYWPRLLNDKSVFLSLTLVYYFLIMESINLELTDKQKQAIKYIASETSRDLNTVLSLVISEGIIFRFGSVSDYRVCNADKLGDEIKKESDYRLGHIKDEIKENTEYCLVNGTNKKSIVNGDTFKDSEVENDD